MTYFGIKFRFLNHTASIVANFSGSCRSANKVDGVLGSYAAHNSNFVPPFRDNLTVLKRRYGITFLHCVKSHKTGKSVRLLLSRLKEIPAITAFPLL
jgi:hypothetical protein